VGTPFEPPQDFTTAEDYRLFICDLQQRPPIPHGNIHWPEELTDIIQRCWLHDPNARPSMQVATKIIRNLRFTLEVKTHLTNPKSQAFWLRHFPGERQIEWKRFLRVMKYVHKSNQSSFQPESWLQKVFCFNWVKNKYGSQSIGLKKFEEINNIFGDFFVEGYSFDQRMSFVDKPWFHGDIPREVSTARLNGRPNYFLVRYGSKSPFTLSWNAGTQVLNCAIEYKHEHYVAPPFMQDFSSLQEVLQAAAKKNMFSLSKVCPTDTVNGYFQ